MHIDAVYGAIGRFVVRFRWMVVVVWIIGSFAAAHFLPTLASVTQSDNTKFLPSSAPSMHAATLAQPFGTTNLQPIPVVAATSNGAALTSVDAAALAQLSTQFTHVGNVTQVRNLGTSSNRQAVQLVALAKYSGNPNEDTDIVDAMRAKIADAHLPAGLQVHLAGDIAVQVDQQKASGNTGNQLQGLTIVFIVLLLLLIFRSLSLALTTLIAPVLAITLAGPLVGLAGEHGLQVSPIAQLLLIVLVLGAGTDYGLFLVFRVREELRGGLPPNEAIVKSITRVGESITFSAATVIAALLTLLAATFPFYSQLGAPLAIGIGVMLVAGLTLLPALLSIRITLIALKRRVFSSWFGREQLIKWSIQTKSSGGAWGRVAGRIVRRPVPTLVIGVVVFGALAIGATGYKAGGFAGQTSAPGGSDSAKGQTLLAKFFPQASANPTNIIFKLSKPVWDDPAALVTAAGQLKASGLFTQVSGPLNPTGVTLTPTQFSELHGALGNPKTLPSTPPPGSKIPTIGYDIYRATANFVSPDGRTVQFETGLKAGDAGTNAAMNAVPSIRTETSKVATSIGASDSAVGGEAPALSDISSISDSDLVHVIPIAIVVIGLLLCLVMRSLVAPLYLIASVAISYLAALGLSVLLFINLDHQSGITFFLPFLMFIFLLALGEDYNILVMTRIREEARQLRLREAVTRAVAATGNTVTSAGLVLAGTFGVLVIVAGSGSQSSFIRDIGVGLGLGILMDTFLVRTLLVPATVVLLGRWNWWPSRMSRGHEHPDAVPGAPSLNGAANTTGNDQPERLAPADPPSMPE
ncbi:MAG TPA: MMPL family transporter [Streptosporangiaceae bacterium]|jgi:RND superfamily putative drug exporter|nr:MMPL family transporter [Streptosporangiaceae bacterium]